MIRKLKENSSLVKLYLLVILVFSVFVTLIFNDSLWGDEAYTMLMLKQRFIDITSQTAADVHPPLYYYISKLFTLVFGYSVTAVKLASITPVVLISMFIIYKSKKLFKKDWETIYLV